MQQHHRAVVHPVEHVTLGDHLAERGQLGVCPAGLVDHRVRRAIRSRPIGQRPGLGDHRRERPLLHLRSVHRRLLCGRGCWLGAGHRRPRRRSRPRRPGRPLRPAPTSSASPLAPAAAATDRGTSASRRGECSSRRVAAADGIRFVSTRGLTMDGVRKVRHAVRADALGELEGRRLLLGAPLAAHEPRWLQVLARADGLLPRRGARVQRRAVRDPIEANSPDALGSGNPLTPLLRMHSANFTAFCTWRRCCRRRSPLPVAGALEPHALIRATIAIRASAASGRRRLLMVSSAGRDRVDISCADGGADGRGRRWPSASFPWATRYMRRSPPRIRALPLNRWPAATNAVWASKSARTAQSNARRPRRTRVLNGYRG